MKIGDLVKHRNGKVGIVVDILTQKHWDCDELGGEVSWTEAPMRNFANVMYREGMMTLMVADLEVISESR